MAEMLYAVGDIGATNQRIGIYNSLGELRGEFETATNPEDYEGTVTGIADKVEELTPDGCQIEVASFAVASELDENGFLVKSGGLSPWIGQNLGRDLATALDMPEERVATNNDVVVIALSQQEINRRNGLRIDGVAATISSGFNVALYFAGGGTKSDEAGHEHLREGAMCACGEDGHVEAYVSGNGVLINKNMPMKTWLETVPGARQQLAADIATSFVQLIYRHEADMGGFLAEELRWTGTIALKQRFMMFEMVAPLVREHFKELTMGSADFGEQAGLHGTFVAAQKLLQVD